MTKGKYVYNISVTALFTAIIAVCAWISVGLGPVPFTLQTMGVLCAGGLLGWKRGVAAVLAYILLGAAGLPVFSGFSGGVGVIFGATGGYLIGFIPAVIIIGLVSERYNKSLPSLALGMTSGVIVYYIIGTLWYMNVYAAKTGPVGLSAALLSCVVPFIIPDLLKVALSILIVKRVSRHIKV